MKNDKIHSIGCYAWLDTYLTDPHHPWTEILFFEGIREFSKVIGNPQKHENEECLGCPDGTAFSTYIAQHGFPVYVDAPKHDKIWPSDGESFIIKGKAFFQNLGGKPVYKFKNHRFEWLASNIHFKQFLAMIDIYARLANEERPHLLSFYKWLAKHKYINPPVSFFDL